MACVEKPANKMPRELFFNVSPDKILFERLPGFLSNDKAPDKDEVYMYQRMNIAVRFAMQP